MYPLTNITNTRLEITLRFDYVLFIVSFSMVSILCSLLFTAVYDRGDKRHQTNKRGTTHMHVMQ